MMILLIIALAYFIFNAAKIDWLFWKNRSQKEQEENIFYKNHAY